MQVQKQKSSGLQRALYIAVVSEFSVLNTIYSVYSVDGLPHLWYNAYALGR